MFNTTQILIYPCGIYIYIYIYICIYIYIIMQLGSPRATEPTVAAPALDATTMNGSKESGQDTSSEGVLRHRRKKTKEMKEAWVLEKAKFEARVRELESENKQLQQQLQQQKNDNITKTKRRERQEPEGNEIRENYGGDISVLEKGTNNKKEKQREKVQG